MVENAIKQIFAQIRIMKDALDSRLGRRLPAESAILAWIVEYASVLLNRFAVGKDGVTAYRRVRGKTCSRPIAEFGEMIFWNCKKTHSSRLQQLEPRWDSGVYLGMDGKSVELLVGSSAGIHKTHAGNLTRQWQ